MSSACFSGQPSSHAIGSSSMLRKTKRVVGHMHFSGDKGIPMSLAAWSTAWRLDTQISELGGPNVK